jgi:hypothetical protein
MQLRHPSDVGICGYVHTQTQSENGAPGQAEDVPAVDLQRQCNPSGTPTAVRG